VEVISSTSSSVDDAMDVEIRTFFDIEGDCNDLGGANAVAVRENKIAVNTVLAMVNFMVGCQVSVLFCSYAQI